MTVSKIFMICNAYESGVGHGMKNDGLENPYIPGSDEHEAYDIGYQEGVETKKETGFKRSRDRVASKNTVVIAGGATGETEIALLSAIKKIGFDGIIIADDEPQKIKPGTLKFEIPERHHLPKRRDNNAKRCGYSTKIRKRI